MERWVDKVAIVTGASAGIGAAIAEKLVKEGLKVVGFARRKEKVDELSRRLQEQKGKLYAVKADITKEDEIVAAFDWIIRNVGPVHVLVNNAGIARNTSLIDGDDQKWKDIFDTNVLGLCMVTREAIKIMKEYNINGHIIHINSVAGHKVTYFPGVNVYPASKFAVTALAETLRHELNNNKLKIKITSISPGTVKTELAQVAGFETLSPEVLEKFGGNFPYLNVEDVADAILYVLRTPPHVLVQELTIRPIGEPF